MKNNYILKTIASLFLFTFFCSQLNAQIKIVNVNPVTNSVTLHNYGGGTVNVSSYWLCDFPAYRQLSDVSTTIVSGSLNLTSGSEVTVTNAVVVNDVVDSELGLYTSNATGFTSLMIDYLQWGSAGHMREGVANTAGVWVTGTFISVPAPFEYNGDGNDIGVNFWQTALSVDDFKIGETFKLSPNPTTAVLNLSFRNSINEGSIDIYDLTGKVVLNRKVANSNFETVDVSDWSEGLYLISVKSEAGSQTKRFVKNN